MNNIIKYMEGDFVMDRLIPVLGSEREAKSYVASAMISVNDSSDLMACSPASIFQAVMRAAILKLRVDKVIGEAWIVPRGGQATFQIGWAGYYSMAMKTREYRRIDTMKIDDGVFVEMDFASGKPLYKFDRSSKGGWFAIFEMTNGYTKWIYWDAEKMQTHYKKYAPNNPIWKSSYDKMALKTIGTHLFKKWGVFDEKDQKVLNSLGEDGEMKDLPELESGLGDVIDGQAEERNEKETLAELGFESPKEKDHSHPRSANAVKKDVIAMINKCFDQGVTVGDNDYKTLAATLTTTLGDKTKRYELCQWLVGVASAKEMSPAQVKAMLKWQGVSGFGEMPSDDVLTETRSCHTQALKDAGQLELT